MTRQLQGFRKSTLGIAVAASTLLLTACGGSGTTLDESWHSGRCGGNRKR